MKKKYLFTQEQCDNMIRLHSEGWLNREIAEYYNTSKATINRQLVQLGVESRHPKLSEERISKAIALYQKYQNLTKAAKELKMNAGTLHHLLDEHHIPVLSLGEVTRYRVVDEEYFSVIDNHRKAYYFGLLFADGCISGKTNNVSIGLQDTDKYILEQFQKDIKTDYPLTFVERRTKHPNWKNQYQLALTNKKFHDSLLAYGMMPQKSLKAEFPSRLSPEYYSSFILGFSDGNGHISKTECRANFVSTNKFCLAAKEIIENTLGIHCSISKNHVESVNPIYCLSIAGRRQVKKYLDWIYSQSDIYLYRKHDVYVNKYCI